MWLLTLALFGLNPTLAQQQYQQQQQQKYQHPHHLRQFSQEEHRHGADCDPNTRLRQTLPSAVAMGQLTPDATKLISGYENQTLAVWDVATGRVIRNLWSPDQKIFYYEVIFRLSPDGSRLCIICLTTTHMSTTVMLLDGRILLNFTTWYQEAYITSVLAWSPDSTMIVSRSSPFNCMVWNASTGERISEWICGDVVMASCWSPGAVIAVSTYERVTGHYPNGVLAFDVSMIYAISLAWMPTSPLLAVGGSMITLLDEQGNIVNYARVESTMIIWTNNGAVLVSCNEVCTLYRSDLSRSVLELRETSFELPVGFSPDGMFLVTYQHEKGHSVYNTKTMYVQSLTTGTEPCCWLDRDNFLFATQKGSRVQVIESNVRSGKEIAYYVDMHEVWAKSKRGCVVEGELLVLEKTGNVTAFVHGVANRTWNSTITSPNATIFCAYERYVAIALGHVMLLWDKFGQLKRNFTLSAKIDDVGLVDLDTWAFLSNYSLYHWDPLTSQEVYLNQTDVFRWSPDGSWLAFRAEELWRVYETQDWTYQDFLTNIVAGPVELSWSIDSSLLMVGSQYFASAMICPRLSMVSGVGQLNAARWNPVTYEVAASSGWSVYIWNTPPAVLTVTMPPALVDQTTPIDIVLAGGKFVVPVPTMIRWVDSSTSIPQCIITNATPVDSYTLKFSVTLNEPGLYTIFLNYPTQDLCTSWVELSQYNFPVSCPGDSMPSLNNSGGLTNCICPHDKLATNVLGVCQPCPYNAYCDGTSHVNAKEGYWQDLESGEILACAVGACGGNNSCTEGYEGPLCGHCKPGYGQHGLGRCQHCSTRGVKIDILFLLGGFILWGLFTAVQSLFAMGWRSKYGRKGGNNSNQLAAILMTTTQTNALLLSANVNLDVQALGFPEEKVQGAGIQSAVFSCVALQLGVRREHIHYTKQIILLVLPIIVCIALMIARSYLQLRRKPAPISMVLVPTVVVWTSVQSFINTSLFQTLTCRRINVEGLVEGMRHDLSVVCHTELYKEFVWFVTVPAIVVTMILIPSGIFYLLRFRPGMVISGHLRFLVKSYRREWWFLVIFARKVVLSAIITVTRNPFYVSAWLLLWCALQVTVSPSTSRAVNLAETISLMTSVFIFSAAGALGLFDPGFGTYNYGPAFLIGAGSLSYLFQVVLILRDRYQAKIEADETRLKTVVHDSSNEQLRDHLTHDSSYGLLSEGS